ncbi:MAG TPA: porin family protein [Myxococcota bacterium]|nr:porin family protein [Myxococcota bacterium]
MRSVRFVIMLALALGATGAAAQDFARSGLYGQVNGVATFESFDGVPSSGLDTGIGASGRLGFRMTPNIAVEGLVEYSGDFSDISGLDLTSTLFLANARYYFLTDRIQPYAALGLGGQIFHIDPGPDEGAFAVRFGGGLDYYISETWGLTGEFAYNVATGDLDDLNYMSLGWGAFFRF